MTSPDPRESRLESRLVRVEDAVAALTAELAAIRTDLAAQRGAPARTVSAATGSPQSNATTGASRPSPGRRRTDTVLDLERLLGRYGMLVIAVLAAAAAVGTFLSWAITRGYLHVTPPARIAVGLAFGAAIFVWGARVRPRERSFGSSLIALALVVVHVCAYAAGPGFALVPTAVAFAGAAAASWALALGALHENDEPLWCVGMGGAAIAPFVTSNGHGNLYALLAYGLVVTLPATLAIRHRSWPVAWRLFYAATALFVVAGAAMADRGGLPARLVTLAFPFVIALAGVVPFAPDSWKRGALRWLIALALIVAPATWPTERSVALPFGMALLAAACVALLLGDRQARLPQSSIVRRLRESPLAIEWLDAAILPALFFGEAIGTTPGGVPPVAVYGLGVAAFSIFSWRRRAGGARDASAVAAAAMSALLIGQLSLTGPVLVTSAFAAAGLLALAVHRARPSGGWLGSGLALLGLSIAISSNALLARPRYAGTPFMTPASASALVATVALVVVMRFWQPLYVATRAAIIARPPRVYRAELRVLLRVLTLAAWWWAFAWVLIELGMAWSPSTSALLVVTYLVACGVGCVAAGRRRRAPRLRQLGLGLALAGAGTAVYGASAYFDPGMRILAYLVTSAFLLGIAYWYRRPGSGVAVA